MLVWLFSTFNDILFGFNHKIVKVGNRFIEMKEISFISKMMGFTKRKNLIQVIDVYYKQKLIKD